MTLDLYFANRFLISFIRVFFGIILLVFIFDFLTNLSRLNEVDAPIWNALVLTALRTTTYISIAMPLIIMLSALAFSVSLTRSNEFIISRSSGLSAFRSLLSVNFCAFILGLISIFILDPFAGKMLKHYDTKIDKILNKDAPKVLANENGFWMRQPTLSGHQIIKATNVSDNGTKLHHVTLFNYNKDGNIQNRIFSENVIFTRNYFILKDATKWIDEKIITNDVVTGIKIKTLKIKTQITPSQLLDGFASPETISLWNMNRQIQIIKSSGFSVIKYESRKMEQYAKPFLFIIMVIIGTVFTLKRSRSRNIGISVVLAVGSGFFLHFFQNFCVTLGRSGEINLIIASWSPILSVGLIALTLFLHYEDG